MLSQDREIYFGLRDVKWKRRPWDGIRMLMTYAILISGALVF